MTIKLGTMVRGTDIGLKDKYHYWVRHSCIGCGKERWVMLRNRKPQNSKCCSCANKKEMPRGSASKSWNGGHHITRGYVRIYIPSDDFFFPMAGHRCYILEHRLVMAKKLGRCLQKWEHVHHKGIRYADIRNKSDNLDDNLELTTVGSHSREHSKGYRDGYAKGLIDGRNQQIEELKKEIRLLRLQVNREVGIL